MQLWLARHAQPVLPAGICYGTLDVDVNDQANHTAALALAQALPRGIPLRSSPSLRCGRLAAALLALRTDLTCCTDVRLREMDFGRWEGRSWGDIGPAALQAWTDDFEHYQPGGAESVHQLMVRVGQAWDEACGSGLDMVWLTHAGVIRAVTLLASGHRSVTHAAQWPVDGCGFGQWRLVSPQARAIQR